MEKSVKTISRSKFLKLSVQRRHELLAELAADAAEGGDIEAFLARYRELHGWTQLDRYEPPAWLSIPEALAEYRAFHGGFSTKAGEADLPECTTPALSWQPRFNVEIVLDQVRSPYNVGSVLRLIDNFGFAGLVHSSAWLRLEHPRLCRAARGAEGWIPVRYEPDLPGYLQQSSVDVIAIENDAAAVPVGQWQSPRACILVLG
ncbi:MAG: RNA methyltransferase, partial [Deltaproteobacteria bacterium]|nr:RNA methyltransferase [Deltaproteobacteria bacterium]